MSGHTQRANGRTEQFHRPKVVLIPIEDMPHVGAIKWYEDGKRFGFVTSEDGQDAFLHGSVVRLYGLRPEWLMKGVRVSYCIETPVGRGPEVTAIALR